MIAKTRKAAQRKNRKVLLIKKSDRGYVAGYVESLRSRTHLRPFILEVGK